MGTQEKKQFMDLGGVPVVVHSLRTFQESSFVESVLLVVSAEDIFYCSRDIVDRYELDKVTRIVEGGPERVDSVYNALKVVPKSVQTVLIHDAARPFLNRDLLHSIVRLSSEYDAVIPALDIPDTLKEVVRKEGGADRVARTVNRESYRMIQTPQSFRREVILKAYEVAREEGVTGTDDAFFLERMDSPVMVIPGSPLNFKITTREDLDRARALNSSGMIS
jgi:2-C-methyl-D-erythritol 4-phosphate cytidylyltransferase